MTNKPTDAQIALLHSGLHRTDRCVVVPIGEGGTAKKLAARMIDAGWLREVRAKPEAPIWRSDRATGSDFSLKLIAAGFKAICATEKPVLEIDPIAGEPGDLETADRIEAKQSQSVVQDANRVQPNFREGSKLATAVALLRRDGGAMIEQLSAVMNWLPHSARAMLTGLRKRGVVITRRKAPGEHASAYAIETDTLEAPGQG